MVPRKQAAFGSVVAGKWEGDETAPRHQSPTMSLSSSSGFHTSTRAAGLAKGLAGCCAIIATSALVPLYLRQDRLVYMPSKEMVAEPADFGLEAEDMWVETEDGVKIHSWLLSLQNDGEERKGGQLSSDEGQSSGYDPEEESTVTVLFFHGNAGNISGRLQNCRVMLEALRNQEAAARKSDAEEAACAAEKPELGIYHRLRRRRFRVCAVDYRGFGLSHGEPSMPGLQKDAKAVLRAATGWKAEQQGANEGRADADPDDSVVVFGRSLGGAVALDLAASERHAAAEAAGRGEDPSTVTPLSRIRGLVVENTFTSVRDVIDVHYPALRPFKSLVRSDWDNVRAIQEINRAGVGGGGLERDDGPELDPLPLLFLSGRCDELLPASMMDTLYRESKKEAVVAEGGTGGAAGSGGSLGDSSDNSHSEGEDTKLSRSGSRRMRRRRPVTRRLSFLPRSNSLFTTMREFPSGGHNSTWLQPEYAERFASWIEGHTRVR